MSKINKGQWLCSLAMVLVGSTVVVSKFIGEQVEPFLATALRHALALPVFAVLMVLKAERLPRPSWRDVALLLLQAAAGSVGYTVLLMHGVLLAGAADTGIVTGTLPAVAALFAVLFLRERPGLRLILAIGLAALGVMVVAISPTSAAAGINRLLGIALVLAAVACEAVFILANKRLSQPIAALSLSTLMSAGGLLLSLPAAYFMWWATGMATLTIGVSAWAGIAYYAWVPTVVGFVLWYSGSARTTGTRAALSTVWLPVSALLLSAVFFAEPIHLWQWIGLGCVLLAMVLAATAPTGTRPE